MAANIVRKGWFPALLTAVAVLGLIFYDSISYTITVPVLIVLLCLGGVMAVINARQERVERHSARLSQLASHFSRRFMGNSTISIFVITVSLEAVSRIICRSSQLRSAGRWTSTRPSRES